MEHLIRAASSIANDSNIVVLGSQAILGQYPDAPAEFLVSKEADLFPKHHPERADLIDGTIGEGSPFERTYGYFAHGVGPETAVLPEGWQDRLIVISNPNTLSVRGWCLDVHDLAIAKLVAGKEKDLDFVEGLQRHAMGRVEILRSRLALTKLKAGAEALAAARIARIFKNQ